MPNNANITIYSEVSEILTLEKAHNKDGRNLLPNDASIIKNGFVVFDEDKILYVGEKIPEIYKNEKVISLKNKTLVPEIVDAHTHLIFAGNRAFEYTLRLNGASYEEIAKSGGGIVNTTNATLNATRDELFNLAKERIERINSYGIGTIEIKSGYGLTYEKEYELSHIIDDLKKYFAPKIQIINTFMAAHAVPKNFTNSSDYMNEIVIPLLKKLEEENILDAVDIFEEDGYFTREDTIKLMNETKLPMKIHADEFIDGKTAKFAAENNFLSCEHLMKTTDDGINALTKSNTIANLLPGTSFFLGKQLANAKLFLDKGCKVAISSDYNPGSCHIDNVLLIASMCAPTYKMNQTQMWAAITLNAAHALGLKNQGAIINGMKPRFSIFDTKTVSEITYNLGRNLLK